MPTICERIRRARREILRISQEEAARRIGMSVKGYRAYETFREPSFARLRQIATAFDIDETYFLRLDAVRPSEDATIVSRHVADELNVLRERLDRLEEVVVALARLAPAPILDRAQPLPARSGKSDEA
jgi:transcriptional regulator with XRE-family HTH domain